jgi:hypothetical protein
MSSAARPAITAMLIVVLGFLELYVLFAGQTHG